MKLKNCFCILLCLWSIASFAHEGHTNHPDSKLTFIPNEGQWHENVEYKVPLGRLNTLYLEENAFTFVYYDNKNVTQMHDLVHASKEEQSKFCLNGHRYKMSFVNAQTPTFKRFDKQSAYHNYFLGNDPNKWASRVGLYETIQYENLYEGIDLKAYSFQGRFKYDFILEPQADATQIALSYEGMDRISIKEGNLIIRTSVETIAESKPYAYQIIEGKEVIVPCQYRLENNVVTFDFPEGYDETLPLVIDPVLVAATWVGSEVENWGHCATYDDDENIYIGARVFGEGYLTTIGAFQTEFEGGSVDMAVSKFDDIGSDLICATYLGGDESEYPYSLFVDENQNICVFGTSNSSDYPTTTNAFSSVNSGETDIIVTKLTNDGSALVGSTYIGGTEDDGLNYASQNYGDIYRGEVYTDADNNVYIASCSESPYFPTTEDVIQEGFGGNQDGVLFKLNNDLSELIWSTYLGGVGIDMCYGLRINSEGNVYVTGAAGSDDFPSTTGGLYENHLGGNRDAFISCITEDGTNMIHSTFWGTNSSDIAFFIDLDENEDVAIFGQSNGVLEPTSNVYSQENSKQFISGFTADLSNLEYSTLIGGEGNNESYGLIPSAFVVDACGFIHFSGYYVTSNLEATADALYTECLNCQFYMGTLEKYAQGLHYATYYTGDHVDGGTSRFSEEGILYQALCHSGEFATTPSAFDTINESFGYSATVLKIDAETFSEECILIDTMLIDTTMIDTMLVDTTMIDTMLIDTTMIDTMLVDTTMIDTMLVDTTMIDTMLIDTTRLDTVNLALNILWANPNITLYPNPSSSNVTISTTNNKPIKAIEFYDIQGKLLVKYKDLSTNTYVLERQEWSSGMYLLKIHTEDNISSHKLILK